MSEPQIGDVYVVTALDGEKVGTITVQKWTKEYGFSTGPKAGLSCVAVIRGWNAYPSLVLMPPKGQSVSADAPSGGAPSDKSRGKASKPDVDLNALAEQVANINKTLAGLLDSQ